MGKVAHTRTTCSCCRGVFRFHSVYEYNVNLGMFWDEWEGGAICPDCNVLIKSTKTYDELGKQIKELEKQRYELAIEEVQKQHNFSPPEVTNLH